jgi:hypothetical protein
MDRRRFLLTSLPGRSLHRTELMRSSRPRSLE